MNNLSYIVYDDMLLMTLQARNYGINSHSIAPVLQNILISATEGLVSQGLYFIFPANISFCNIIPRKINECY